MSPKRRESLVSKNTFLSSVHRSNQKHLDLPSSVAHVMSTMSLLSHGGSNYKGGLQHLVHRTRLRMRPSTCVVQRSFHFSQGPCTRPRAAPQAWELCHLAGRGIKRRPSLGPPLRRSGIPTPPSAHSLYQPPGPRYSHTGRYGPRRSDLDPRQQSLRSCSLQVNLH